MKPTLNYGLSDSLIDAVRKTVEEAKLHPNQQKLDVHEPEKDELTSHDFRELRSGKHAGKKVKYRIDTHPKLKEEEYEQMDESLDSIAKKHGMKYTTTAYGAGMKHPTKGEISINRYGEWHHKGTNKTGDSENDFSSLDKHLSTVKEEEQIDELSVHKMLKYTDANKEKRKELNTKWDAGTATEREKNKVLGHEMGADRAAARIKAKTGKNPHEIGKLSRIKYAITREEEQMDEAPLRAVNALVGYSDQLNKKVPAKGTPGSEDERNKAAAGLRRDRMGLGRRYTGDPHYDVRREEYEQMDEANSDNPEFEGRLAAIDMHHYKEADQHRRTLRTLGTQGKLNTPEGKFHKAALEKHQATLNAMAASDHESMRKKLKQSMRSNLKREEYEHMDEARSEPVDISFETRRGKTENQQEVEHAARYEKSHGVKSKFSDGPNGRTVSYSHPDSKKVKGALIKHHGGEDVSHIKIKEAYELDEVKLADLPRRKVVGKSYGADYVDPEGADDADMKKAEPKRKSGPQGTMKRRFDTKSYAKLKSQYK